MDGLAGVPGTTGEQHRGRTAAGRECSRTFEAGNVRMLTSPLEEGDHLPACISKAKRDVCRDKAVFSTEGWVFQLKSVAKCFKLGNRETGFSFFRLTSGF